MEPKWEAEVSTKLADAKADQIWPLFEDFFGLHKWFPGLPTCYGVEGNNSEIGCVRYCAGFSLPAECGEATDVSWSKESLTAIDPIERILSYEMVDGNIGFKSYVSTVKITPDEDGGCVIRWSITVDPVAGWRFEDLLKKYEAALRRIAEKMEAAVLAGSA